MTEQLNENQLKTEFRQLRETETQVASDFRRSLTGVPQVAPGRRFRPAFLFAMTAAVLLVPITQFLGTSRNQSIPETVKIAPFSTAEITRVATSEMPTDFLLDTPWFDLARTTPNFDIQFPQYDIPEDHSDEI